MKLEYSVAEFRAKTREILNAVDMGAEVIIKRYENKYRLAPFMTYSEAPKKVNEALDAAKPLDLADPDNTILENGKVVKKNIRLAQPKKKKAVPAGISEVQSCPHGYAIGNCKKEACNRKYRG